MQQLKTDIDLRGHINAILADGVVCLCRRLQSQIVDEKLVPRPHEMEAFIAQLARIQNCAPAHEAPAVEVVAVETLPQHADMAARDGDDNIREKNRDQEQ